MASIIIRREGMADRVEPIDFSKFCRGGYPYPMIPEAFGHQEQGEQLIITTKAGRDLVRLVYDAEQGKYITDRDIARAALPPKPEEYPLVRWTLYVTEWTIEEEHYRIDEDGDEEHEGWSADTIVCDWPEEACIYSDDYRWSAADDRYIEIEDEDEIEDD